MSDTTTSSSPASAGLTTPAPSHGGGGGPLIDPNDLFQARPTVHLEPPENFDDTNVSLQELRQLERTLVQHPDAKWSTAQRLFFECLLADPHMDAGRAAKKADVKPATAKRWLSNPETQDALNYLMTRRCEMAGIDPVGVVRAAYRGLRMALGEEDVHRVAYDKDCGFVTESLRATDLGAAARFVDILAKINRLYTDEVSETPPININFDLSGGKASVSVPD